MKLAPLAIITLFVLAIAQGVKAAVKPEPEPAPTPQPPVKRKKKPRPPSQRRPFKVEFFVRVSGIEKWAVDEKDVREAIQKNAHIGPGSGPPRIFVKDAPGGYRCRIEWPDSHKTISAKDMKILIEGIDPRMFGRVSQVKVIRK